MTVPQRLTPQLFSRSAAAGFVTLKHGDRIRLGNSTVLVEVAMMTDPHRPHIPNQNNLPLLRVPLGLCKRSCLLPNSLQVLPGPLVLPSLQVAAQQVRYRHSCLLN